MINPKKVRTSGYKTSLTEEIKIAIQYIYYKSVYKTV